MKKDNESIYKNEDEKEVINNNNIEKIERKINIFKSLDITEIKELMPKDYNKKNEIQKCKIYYKTKRCTSNLKGKLGETICKFYLIGITRKITLFKLVRKFQNKKIIYSKHT